MRTNTEVQELYRNPDNTAEIKSGRIRCLGDVWRMADSSVPKKVF